MLKEPDPRKLQTVHNECKNANEVQEEDMDLAITEGKL